MEITYIKQNHGPVLGVDREFGFGMDRCGVLEQRSIPLYKQ